MELFDAFQPPARRLRNSHPNPDATNDSNCREEPKGTCWRKAAYYRGKQHNWNSSTVPIKFRKWTHMTKDVETARIRKENNSAVKRYCIEFQPMAHSKPLTKMNTMTPMPALPADDDPFIDGVDEVVVGTMVR